MVDENTQTDASSSGEIGTADVFSPQMNAEKVQSQPAEALWIPFSADNSPSEDPVEPFESIKAVEPLESIKAVEPLPERAAKIHQKKNLNDSLKDDFRHQKDNRKLETDTNLLEICSRFLSSPILQILDLTVLNIND